MKLQKLTARLPLQQDFSSPRPLSARDRAAAARGQCDSVADDQFECRTDPVIDHLKIDSKPSIRVIENPHALVIHGETPGQLVLLGAERGQWEVTVTRDDGAQVAYRVDVAAIADSATPLDAGTGPVASSDRVLPKPAAPEAYTSGPPETVRPAHAVDAFSSDVAPHQNSPR